MRPSDLGALVILGAILGPTVGWVCWRAIERAHSRASALLTPEEPEHRVVAPTRREGR
jgi:hypothetical protein